MSTEQPTPDHRQDRPEDQEADWYTELAALLHSIADDVATLAGRGLPEEVSVGLRFQPIHDVPQEDKVALVDAVGQTLLGKRGELKPLSGGTFHHDVSGYRGERRWPQCVEVAAYTAVEPPELRALREEVERLTAERTRLRAEAGTPPDADEGEPSGPTEGADR